MAVQLRCSNCDKLCSADEKYCPYCHEPLNAVVVNDAKELDGFPIDRWETFIGPKAEEYLKVFTKHTDKKWFRASHLWAILFSVEWLMYRKMYWQAAIAFVISSLFVLGVSVSWYLSPPFTLFFYPFLIVAAKIVFGFYAHAIYKMHCLRQLAKGLSATANGGVSVASVIVYEVLAGMVANYVIEPITIALVMNLT